MITSPLVTLLDSKLDRGKVLSYVAQLWAIASAGDSGEMDDAVRETIELVSNEGGYQLIGEAITRESTELNQRWEGLAENEKMAFEPLMDQRLSKARQGLSDAE